MAQAHVNERAFALHEPGAETVDAVIHIYGTSSSHIEDLTIPLHHGAMAVLRTPWPLSKENFEALERWLTFAKGLAAPSEPPKSNADA
jgi:hypothetical protein